MTLDEAIAKAKADGDVQLAEWLRQARGADAAARWYTEKLRDANRTIRKLLDENAKLRELVRMMWKTFCWAQSGYDVCLTDEQDKAIRDFVRKLGIEVN